MPHTWSVHFLSLILYSTSASAGVLAASLLTLRLLEDQTDLPPPKLFLGLYGMTNIASSFYNVPKTYEQSVSKDTSQRRMADVAYLFDGSRAPCMGTDVQWFRTTIDSAKTEAERVEYDQTNLYVQLGKTKQRGYAESFGT